MTPTDLVCQLEHATCELLAALELDLDRVEKVLECRSAVLARIATCRPGAFSQSELSSLRAAVRKGEAALERLTLLRRDAAAELHRLKRVCPRPAEAVKNTVSLSA